MPLQLKIIFATFPQAPLEAISVVFELHMQYTTTSVSENAGVSSITTISDSGTWILWLRRTIIDARRTFYRSSWADSDDVTYVVFSKKLLIFKD